MTGSVIVSIKRSMLLPSGRGPLVRAFETALLVRGPGGTSRAHAHHWWHLVLPRKGSLRVEGPEEDSHVVPGVLTPPNLRHAIEAEGEIAILFVEPDSQHGRSLAAAHPDPTLRVLTETEAAALHGALQEAPSEAVLDTLLRTLEAPPPPPAKKHPPVARVVRFLEKAPADADVSLEALAERAGLSPGRLMHAFTEHVGLPIRPFIRWLRLRRAAAALLDGATAAEAAHGAGFADAAHMTRTFREMFGVTPSELSRRSQSVQAGS